MALRFVSLENSLSHLLHLKQLSPTHQPMFLNSKRTSITYHPQLNGMVEHFHRQLKAAQKAQTQPDSWMDALPLVLLGIRTTLKEDISSTVAEMVYGTTLHLKQLSLTHQPMFLN